jgi:hypothetical protein
MRRRDFLAAMAAASVLLSIGWNMPAATQQKAIGRESEIKNDAGLFTQSELTPVGQYYEASVPDTLDLAERARLAVRGLINFGDAQRSYENYQIGYFNAQPAWASHFGAVGCNWGKLTESILMTRHMSGSKENLAKEEEMFKGILRLINDKGEFAVDASHSWCKDSQPNDSLIPANTSRMLLGFLVQDQLRPSPKLTQLIVRMADSISAAAKIEGDCAYLPGRRTPPWIVGNSGVLGDFQFIWSEGESLRGLVRAYTLTGDRKYLDMAAKFKNALMDPKYWVPEVAPKAVVASEHGQFDGHLHSYLQALMGLIGYAEVTNDAQLKEFVRESYEYARNFGIARIGLYGEMCATGDMTWLAIKLSDLGVGDYWEDIDQYVRNQLVEQQATDAHQMHKVNATMPKLVLDAAKGAKMQLGEVELVDPKYAKMGLTTDHVIDRFVGAWRSDACNPAMIHPQNFIFVVCCTGNNPPALYAAWEATVRCNDGIAQVNLLLNRASPWLDIDSYLPYEGKVVIRNKTAKQMFLRIPRWVDQSKVTVAVNGKARGYAWVGRCLFLDGTQAGDQVRVEFPMVESKETYTLKWKPESRWLEGINPGPRWKPADSPGRYTFLMKGNTLIDVSPRPQGPGFPLYQRTYYQQTKAPTKQVTRYISPVTVKW